MRNRDEMAVFQVFNQVKAVPQLENIPCWVKYFKGVQPSVWEGKKIY